MATNQATRRWLVCRLARNGSTVPVAGLGCDSLMLCGPSAEHVLRNARALGLFGVVAVECDEDGVPVVQSAKAVA